jgi:hypothetical protein
LLRIDLPGFPSHVFNPEVNTAYATIIIGYLKLSPSSFEEMNMSLNEEKKQEKIWKITSALPSAKTPCEKEKIHCLQGPA